MCGQWGLLWLFVLAVLFASASAFGSSTVVIGGFRQPFVLATCGWGIAAGNSCMCWVYAQVVLFIASTLIDGAAGLSTLKAGVLVCTTVGALMVLGVLLHGGVAMFVRRLVRSNNA